MLRVQEWSVCSRVSVVSGFGCGVRGRIALTTPLTRVASLTATPKLFRPLGTDGCDAANATCSASIATCNMTECTSAVAPE